MDIYKSKYEKYKNKYLNLKLNINSTNGGAGGKPQNPTLIADQNIFPKDLVANTFEFMTKDEIYNTCIADSKTCMGINWGKVLEDKGIPYENVTVTQEDIVKYGRFCPILEVTNETQKVQQNYCIIFFKKYLEKFQRTDDDIHKAVYYWINDVEYAKERFGDIKDWDTSQVTNMQELFEYEINFNADLSKWDVSNVTTMNGMFYEAKSFKADLSKWNVSNVKDMSAMFCKAELFTSDLSNWDTGNVSGMGGMFEDAKSFTSDLSKWNVSNVKEMDTMFSGAELFTSDLSKWNVSNVEGMDEMFKDAKLFTSDLSNWDTSNVTNMNFMFFNAISFTSDLSKWNVSRVPGDTVVTYNPDMVVQPKFDRYDYPNSNVVLDWARREKIKDNAYLNDDNFFSDDEFDKY